MHRISRTCFLLSFLPLVAGLGPVAPAAADESATAQSEDAVRAASSMYLSALRAGDGAALRSMWTDRGVYVDASGSEFNARDLIDQEFGDAAGEDNPPAESNAIKSRIRLLPVGAALQEGVADNKEGNSVTFTALWVLQENQWKLDYLRERHDPGDRGESPLGELEWLLGKWKTATDELAATMTVRRSEDQKFLLQTIEVAFQTNPDLVIESRIGWDPRSQCHCSWAFRSDGGFGQSRWTQQGKAWTVESNEVLPSGETTHSTQIWIPEETHTLWFKLHSGEVSGREVDDLVLRFSRDVASN